MKILFLTCNRMDDPTYGGAKATIRNYEALSAYGEVDVMTILKKSNAANVRAILHGYFPPVGPDELRTVREKLRTGAYDRVFFDGSYFGTIARAAREMGVKTITFYHNCEYDYLDVRLGSAPSLKKFVYRRLIARQEKLAAICAGQNIVLTPRDAERIRSLYGVSNISVIPMALPDAFPEGTELFREEPPRPVGERVCLLFGPLGYANEEAFSWFVENVSPCLHCSTLVAGKGFEAYRERWTSDKVTVEGYVEDLAALYARADCVAIPLLSGAGMKIKTCEALMFGRSIYGTEEAFVGYELDTARVGALCRTAEDFIRAINADMEAGRPAWNAYARQIYLERYDMQAVKSAFGRVLFDGEP